MKTTAWIRSHAWWALGLAVLGLALLVGLVWYVVRWWRTRPTAAAADVPDGFTLVSSFGTSTRPAERVVGSVYAALHTFTHPKLLLYRDDASRDGGAAAVHLWSTGGGERTAQLALAAAVALNKAKVISRVEVDLADTGIVTVAVS